MNTLDAFARAATNPLLRVTPRTNNDGPQDAISHLNTPVRTSIVRVQRAMRLLAGFGALRRDQLETLLLADEALSPASRRVATHRAVAELRDRGLVQTIALASRGSAAPRGYALTERGHGLYGASDPGYPRRRTKRVLSVVLLDHAVALADIALAFRDAVTQAGDIALLWESDWEAVARLGTTLAIPDALVTLEQGGWRTRAFIEADRSTEWLSAFATKVRRYVDLYRREEWRRAMGAWPLVLTVTTSDTHACSLARVAQRVAVAEGGSPIARAFRFTSVDKLGTRGALAQIWHIGGTNEQVAILGARPG
jgi:hypothetical protein